MNLAIDIGNSSAKVGIFDGSKKLFVTRIPDITIDYLEDLINRYDIEHIIYSSVAGEPEYLARISSTLEKKIHRLSPSSNLPFSISYNTPETLGTDRIAAVAAARNKFSERNVLVIDAGTAVTFDMLSSLGIYEGGNISPGLSMRFQSLSTFTDNLPLVSPENKYYILGKDTESAIRSGVQQGLIFEINEYIRNFKNLYKDLETIMTGGDGKLLSGMTEQKIVFSPDLVIEGLNYILNYNA